MGAWVQRPAGGSWVCAGASGQSRGALRSRRRGPQARLLPRPAPPSPGLFPSKGLFGQLNGLLIYGTFRCILSARKCFLSSFEVEEGVGVRSTTPGL